MIPKKYWFFFIITLFFSCKEQKSDFHFLSTQGFPEIISLEARVVEVSEDLFVPGKVVSNDEYLVVVDDTKKDILKFFNLPDLTHAFNFGVQGIGPKDLTTVHPETALFDNMHFQIQDKNKVKTFKVYSDSLDLIKSEILPILGNPINRLTKLNDSVYVADNEFSAGDAEMVRININNQVITERFSTYPKVNLEFNSNDAQYFAFLKSIAANPNSGRFVVAYYNFNILRIYDYSGELFKEIRVDGGLNRDYSASNPKDNIIYNAGLVAHKDYIYSLSVMKSKNEIEQDIEEFKPKLIIWDWEGNPLAQYQLDKPVISYTISGDKLYAVGLGALNDIYVYDLPVLQAKEEGISKVLEQYENDYFQTQLMIGWQKVNEGNNVNLGDFQCYEELFSDPDRRNRDDGKSSTMRIRLLSNDADEVSVQSYYEDYAKPIYEGGIDFDLKTYRLDQTDVLQFSRTVKSSVSPSGLRCITWVWESSDKLFEMTMFDFREKNPNSSYAESIIRNTSLKI